MPTIATGGSARQTTMRNYVGGTWVASSAADALHVLNPATGEPLAATPLSTPAEVAQAVDAASRAYPAWRRTPVTDRVQFLFKLKERLEKNFDEISRTITQECGKTLAESRGEMRRAVENVDVACGTPILIQGYNSEDIAAGIDEVMIRQPLGVSAIIAPFNFPGMIPFWFLPYAMACGNTVVIKPSERVPLTMQKVFELIHEIGLPPGVLNLVNGGRDVVNTLIDHPAVRSVSFVGSSAVARHVYSRAAAAGKRAQCQGGAKNPVVILPDADVASAAEVVADSAFGCAGQRCLATSLAITVGSAHDSFVDAIRDKAHSRVVGYGLDEGVQMGPVITPESRARVLKAIDQAVAEGARPLADGRKLEGDAYSRGNFVGPTVIDGLSYQSDLTTTEIFGPVLSVHHVESVDDAIALVNTGSYGNQACLFTTSGANARRFRHEAEVGNIGINIAVAAPMAFFPFSGARDSFFGDLHGQGRDAIEFFTQEKVVVERWPAAWTRRF
jgi:malonate-semialdehyde dehydrogenase (acetylating)/methylmalonate-semialdehyde dehydrogenase